jgi:hypothetical protein
MNYQLKGNQITFNDNRFYNLGDKFYPSVTTILQAYPKDAGFYKWLKEVGNDADTIRDAAGERGTTVHKLTEQYDEGLEVSLISEEGRLNFSMQEWSMFERYVNFRQRFQIEIIASELQLISEKFEEAGTLDRYIEMDGKRLIVDIKTSNAIYNHYWLQLAAYKRMFMDISGQPVDGVAIMWLNAKTRTNGTKGAIQGEGWQMLIREDTEKDLRLYEACKALWLAENEGMKPREISYTLKHQINATP